MNKIVLNIGLLIFFLSVIFFSQRGMELSEILLKSFIIFIVLTILLNIIALIVIRTINKVSSEKTKNVAENLT